MCEYGSRYTKSASERRAETLAAFFRYHFLTCVADHLLGYGGSAELMSRGSTSPTSSLSQALVHNFDHTKRVSDSKHVSYLRTRVASPLYETGVTFDARLSAIFDLDEQSFTKMIAFFYHRRRQYYQNRGHDCMVCKKLSYHQNLEHLSGKRTPVQALVAPRPDCCASSGK